MNQMTLFLFRQRIAAKHERLEFWRIDMRRPGCIPPISHLPVVYAYRTNAVANM